ncbi:MAG: 5-(carboxyamino)imidazole ribonucleotide synthase, partial [Pseudomonadota bacterium]
MADTHTAAERAHARQIGIIGGGQLARMLAMAAARLGHTTVVLDSDPICPASQVCNLLITADYDDAEAMGSLAICDVVTYEFENVDVDAVNAVSSNVDIFPATRALGVAQDRLAEKQFLQSAGLRTADHQDITTAADLANALEAFGGKGILKTRRFGYDGKGQVVFRGNADDPSPQDALELIADAPAILEAFVPFQREISVIATRGRDGTCVCFDPAENVHRNGILRISTVPADIEEKTRVMAKSHAQSLLTALDYVGTLGLEFFVMPDGGLIANEFAPRVHNSGHWTEAACTINQFEMHIRAITGWPLVAPIRHSNAEMHNLLGDEIA